MSRSDNTTPAKYLPDTFGESRYTEKSNRTFHVPVDALIHTGVGVGEYISVLPHDTAAVTVIAGRRTGAIATYQTYDGSRRRQTPSPAVSVAGEVVAYLGLEPGDRVRWEYPTPREKKCAIARRVREGADD